MTLKKQKTNFFKSDQHLRLLHYTWDIGFLHTKNSRPIPGIGIKLMTSVVEVSNAIDCPTAVQTNYCRTVEKIYHTFNSNTCYWYKLTNWGNSWQLDNILVCTLWTEKGYKSVVNKLNSDVQDRILSNALHSTP